MQIGSLKQSEVFAFLAALFLIGVVLSEQHRVESDQRLEAENQHLEEKNQGLELEKQRLKKPPIITLSEETREFRFPSSSAEISAAFVEALRRRTIPELDRLSKEYHCDVIEIIGHTDGVPIKKAHSNIDYITYSKDDLVFGSNLDLGMLRAISVMKIFEEAKKQGALAQIKYFIPYSAGQFVLPDKNLTWGAKTEGDSARRRIEIRLLRSK
uniref:OmpA family protein n=1 Tax=Candidatus Kentrum sp. MB TaxID=2138164 RepID=A0A450XT42_9GAMM|nr:MAG: hypothetical protein BECKMB1821G_GA0114241_11126 [Candidatus Kentron sp. MB]VFK35723.1 MAG: hypothetical protein BECKMB1821I_GA0114274_11402 [Candidatus Kentron sp. MB]VFK77445.1 MAG: hypothetical protein BECKMB1821H_GA0114242_11402 [Candidatus Kentron sp. MB]